MAHEALVSLNLMIETILNSDNMTRAERSIAESIHQEVWSLKSILELDYFEESERLNELKEEILEQILYAMPKFRDGLEGHLPHEIIYLDEMMKKFKEDYNAKLYLETSIKKSPLADEDFGGNAENMVGVYDEDFHQLINKLLEGESSSTVISVVGMAGIGKITLVKTVYNDPDISYNFDTRAFVRIGPNYHFKYILVDLQVCLFNKAKCVVAIREMDEYKLMTDIFQFLIDRRYLIVFDDVWDSVIWKYISWLSPNNDFGSRIIVTTRLSFLTFEGYSKILHEKNHEIRLRNEEESWNLFRRKVFVPPELEKVGKKIVKKCGGLPLGIISIANILSKAEKTLDYWEKVAKDENLLALATEEGSHMSRSLLLSYEHLPPHLKECCLYFGVFPINHEIYVSKLTKLWVGEGLVEAKRFQTFEDTAREYLEDLISHNIVLIGQHCSIGRTKTCSVHYFFWHILVREAANKKILHLINSYPSAFIEGIHCQRRLCIHKNALLGFKHVYKSIESVSNVRSFLCTGPEHQYPVSICLGLTSIKVLDALTIRLYKFPIGILELVELKYIAFTYDGMLPSSISRLKNLVYLIVHRYHLTIINSSPSYMPIEIWNMQELRHLQVMGSDLPHPAYGAQLPNLLTLLGVSNRSCTKEVLRSIPNLKKLGVRIVLPQGVSETLHIFDHIALRSTLKSFKCIVPNPNPRSEQVLLLPKSVFPSRLTKLTLSGCGFKWKDMSIIAALRNLQVLKLRCYAFQGPKWVVKKEFQELEHLLLENTDLVHWRVGYSCFPRLKRLIIMHCYKLEEIPYELGDSKILKMIELVDCSPSALASMKHILEERKNDEQFQVQVYSSLNDEKH